MRPKLLVMIFTCLFSILPVLSSFALEVTSVRPDKVYPGDSLYIAFNQFDSSVKVLVGDQVLQVGQTEAGQTFYLAPDVPAGLYVLQFLSAGETVSTPFRITVLELIPQITELNPGSIPSCAESQYKQIDVVGKNFLDESRLIVNGALVAAKNINRELLTFDASALGPGVHGVQVVNPSGSKSLPFSLYVSNVPKIDSISAGQNYTNHYELVITGENFFQQSTLLVTEEPPGMTGIRPQQKVIWGKGRRMSTNRLLDQEQEEYLFYEDCHTLIYYRFPLSGQEVDLTFKVINPDGKASAAYQMLAN